jgi:hypothetical protein
MNLDLFHLIINAGVMIIIGRLIYISAFKNGYDARDRDIKLASGLYRAKSDGE